MAMCDASIFHVQSGCQTQTPDALTLVWLSSWTRICVKFDRRGAMNGHHMTPMGQGAQWIWTEEPALTYPNLSLPKDGHFIVSPKGKLRGKSPPMQMQIL